MKKVSLLLMSILLTFSQLPLGSLPVYATGNEENTIVMPNGFENENEASNNEEGMVNSNYESRDEALNTKEEIADENTKLGNNEVESEVRNKEDEVVVPSDKDQLMTLNENEFITKNIDGGVAITGYTGTSTNIVIPHEIQGQPVIEIGFYAFSNHQLTSVEIPSSVTKIGPNAFSNNRLTNVDIPSGVTIIETDVFYNNKLKSVTIPEGVTKIGRSAFYDNQLTSVQLPSSLTTIEWSAFSYNQITDIEIPSNVTTLLSSAFRYNQLSSVKIQSGLTTIAPYAFANNQLTNLDIPSSVEQIGEWAFANNRLTNVDIPSSVTTIGWAAFRDNQLTSVKIPSSMTKIEHTTFNHNQLTEVEIPSSITTIGPHAFADNRLTNVVVPSSVTAIEYGAFYKNQLTSVELPSSLTTIDSYAFKDNQLTTVEIPSNVTIISSELFANNQLMSIQIPASVKRIGRGAFSHNKLDFVTFQGEPNFQWTDEEHPFIKQNKEGKNFYGWFEDKNFTTAWGNSISQSMTIYAQWDKEDTTPEEIPEKELPSYIITFDVNGGSKVPSEEVTEGELLQVPTIPKKEGDTFDGWYKDSEFIEVWDFANDEVRENITLYARWTKDHTSEGETGEATANYLVTFDSNGGSKVPSEEVTEGELLPTPAIPEKEEHTFAGWFKDEELTEKWDFNQDIVTKNETLYAEWTKEGSTIGESEGVGGSASESGSGEVTASYTIIFDSNGGSEVPSEKVKKGELLQAPSPPVKEGYTIAGWYKDTDLTKTWDFAKDIVTENLTLYAKWKKESKECQTAFKDMNNHWGEEMIKEIAKRCIIKGYPDGTFRPNNMIQRQHVVLMIERALPLTPLREAVPFLDVPHSHPYYQQITLLQQAGILDGSNGAFRPNAYMTRAQMAKMMVLAFDLTPGGNSSFKDVDPSHWASGYIATLADHNIALGDGNGNFRPNDNLTRAEFTAFMYRALGL